MKEIEATVEIFEKEEDLDKKLKETGFEIVEEFTMDDIYISSKHNSIHELSNYEILKNSFLIRNRNNEKIELLYKKKEYDKEGNTVFEEKYRTPIQDIDSTKMFFENLGFKEIFQISTKNIVYKKEDVELVVQKVKNLGIFIELEMIVQEKILHKKREEMCIILKNLPIKIGNDFDIKKAHLILNKLREK
mgnify:CR=1 FL=1